MTGSPPALRGGGRCEQFHSTWKCPSVAVYTLNLNADFGFAYIFRPRMRPSPFFFLLSPLFWEWEGGGGRGGLKGCNAEHNTVMAGRELARVLQCSALLAHIKTKREGGEGAARERRGVSEGGWSRTQPAPS